MRWFEVLAAALFTLDMTGSGLAVAVVSAARTMPMLLLGAFSGVVSEAANRKAVLFWGQVVTCAASAGAFERYRSTCDAIVRSFAVER